MIAIAKAFGIVPGRAAFRFIALSDAEPAAFTLAGSADSSRSA